MIRRRPLSCSRARWHRAGLLALCIGASAARAEAAPEGDPDSPADSSDVSPDLARDDANARSHRARAHPASDSSRAYCDYVTSVADSDGALLRAPWLFSSFGTLRGTSSADSDVLDASTGDELVLRLQAGVGFSPTRYFLAGLLDQQARAECERHRAGAELRTLGASQQGVTRAALEAKIEVLESALPDAERMLRASLDRLEASRTTLQEHGALELRVDGLREKLATASLELAALPRAEPVSADVSGSFERLRRWTAAKEAVASRLRRAGALSLTLRGGYDELLGVPQSLPIFASVALEFNPGWFWQRSADERAERAHAEAVEADVLGQRQSLAAVAQQLAAQLVVIRRRLAEVRTSLGDLRERRARLEAAGSAAAREYAEYVWFDEVRWRADEAFLAEQLATLQRLTASGGDREP
jgi:hypothetical protein